MAKAPPALCPRALLGAGQPRTALSPRSRQLRATRRGFQPFPRLGGTGARGSGEGRVKNKLLRRKAAGRGSPLAGGAARPAEPPSPHLPPRRPQERLSHLPQRALSSSQSSAPHGGRSSCCYSSGYTWPVHAGGAAFPCRLPSPAPPARR